MSQKNLKYKIRGEIWIVLLKKLLFSTMITNLNKWRIQIEMKMNLVQEILRLKIKYLLPGFLPIVLNN